MGSIRCHQEVVLAWASFTKKIPKAKLASQVVDFGTAKEGGKPVSGELSSSPPLDPLGVVKNIPLNGLPEG